MNAKTAFLSRPWVRCFAIALFLGLLVSPVPIPFRVVVLACAALVWTYLEAGSLRPIGMRRHRLASTLIWGMGLAAGVILVGKIAEPLIEQLTDMKPDYSVYRALMGNPTAALQLLGFAWVSAAFGEEVLFRGFLLHQLTAILGSQRWARWVSIIAAGTVFGLAHLVQGPLGVINTGIVGIVMGWAWFRSDRNLWALMLAHALIDTYSIGMLYFGVLV